jgi:protein-L-isoaspartate(D-aspartate) O-methyltransferase
LKAAALERLMILFAPFRWHRILRPVRTAAPLLGLALGLLVAPAPAPPAAAQISAAAKPLITVGDSRLLLGSAALGQKTSNNPLAIQRRQMVDRQLRLRGIKQGALLEAMQAVPRHEFVPPSQRANAYADDPIVIDDQTSISQPYIVALMTEALGLTGEEKVLEIGTGSGYHTAVLSRLAKKVYTIEIDSELSRQARRNLVRLGFTNIEARAGDGYQGWPKEAPFDAIILTAAPPRMPEPLIEQLKVGGRMVVPVGDVIQDLMVLTKHADGVSVRAVAPVRLPGMTGEVQQPEASELTP